MLAGCKRTGASVKLTVLAKENIRVTDDLGGRPVNQFSVLDAGQDLIFAPLPELTQELLVCNFVDLHVVLQALSW